jgi:signal peptide peptidase SppA
VNLLPHLAARLFGTPLLIHQPKLDLILAVLGQRIGLAESPPPGLYTPAERPAPQDQGAIAVLPIHGTLVRRTVGLEADSGLTSYTVLSEMLAVARDDPNIKAILLDIDSPGGESGGVFDLADRIRAATLVKPVWAVANDMAFSAAYALASAAQKVYISRTGGVGSIGVIAIHVDQSLRDAQEGLHFTAVYAGDRKNDLTPHAPLTNDAQRFLQGEVDRVYGLFVDTVARQRGLSAAVIRNTEAGLYFGKDAVRAGLGDAVGTVDDALRGLTDHLASLLLTPARPDAHSFLTQELVMPQLTPSLIPVTAATDQPLEPPAEPGLPAETAEAVQETQEQPLTPEPAPTEPQGNEATNQAAAAPATAPAFGVHDALEIAQTCALAGRTDLTAGFIEARVPPAKVRARLLADQADRSPEIVSRIAPNSAVSAAQALGDPASPANLMVQTVKGRLAQRAASR